MVDNNYHWSIWKEKGNKQPSYNQYLYMMSEIDKVYIICLTIKDEYYLEIEDPILN